MPCSWLFGPTLVFFLGCNPSSQIPGVSEASPSGHPDVASDLLVVSYDMATLTSDGLLRDFSGGDLHARVSGAKATEGALGGALLFGSVEDRVALPVSRAFDLDGPLTVAAHFRFDRVGQHQHVVACDDKFALWLTTDDHVRFVNTLGDGAETADPLEAGIWHSVIGVFRGTAGDPIDGTNTEVWINGELATSTVGSARASGPPRWQRGELYQTDACYIGFESHQGLASHQTLPFFGAIDQILLFARDLSREEVAALGGAMN